LLKLSNFFFSQERMEHPQQSFASTLFESFLLRPFRFLAILSLNNLPKVVFDQPLSWNVGIGVG
jgi:hypothetical protein